MPTWRRAVAASLLLFLAGCSSRPATLESVPPPSSPPLPAVKVVAYGGGDSLPQWVDGGASLLYVSHPEGQDGWQSDTLMRLDLTAPQAPQMLAGPGLVGGLLSPDGKNLAYVAPSTEGQRPMTIYLKRGDGEPVDALPGNLVKHGMTSVKRLHRWVDDHTLAYQEHMGTSISALFLLDTERLELLEIELLNATYFIWSADGNRVAGQLAGGPPQFWLWDRASGQKIGLPALPGATQRFEAWSPDGKAVLFTAWEGEQATLYRLELEAGRLTKLAEGAELAAWGGGSIAYVTRGATPTLRVVDEESGTARWESALVTAQEGRQGGGAGPASQPAGGTETAGQQVISADPRDLTVARPVTIGQQIAYWSGGGWWVSPLDRNDPTQVYHGSGATFIGSPDGRHAAIVDGDAPQLTVVQLSL